LSAAATSRRKRVHTLLYSEKVLDHFHHPRNVGEIEHPTTVVEMTNPVCGDVLKLSAVVKDGRIREIKFKCAGCVPAVAAGSWVCEWAKGRAVEELRAITAAQIEEGLGGLPAASHHASELVVSALRLVLGGVY
jgi:nitrogen fixation protein NifU and related proteins